MFFVWTQVSLISTTQQQQLRRRKSFFLSFLDPVHGGTPNITPFTRIVVDFERTTIQWPHEDPLASLNLCNPRVTRLDACEQGDENSTAAIYGMASSMPAGPVNVLLRAYTDITLGS